MPTGVDCEWVSDFVQEHLAFPVGVHDDYVDMTSQALIRALLDGSAGYEEMVEDMLAGLGR